jgi:hypothetical protein
MHRTLNASLLVLLLSAATASAQDPTRLTGSFFDQLEYRHIGPVGNRVSAVVGIPGDPNTYYFGAASGGVFKSTDGGIQWKPIFDDQEAQSVGAIAIAQSNPNIVWVGTGESKVRSNISVGNGIYKSTDAGRTWTHMGLDETGRISRVLIHPTNPDIPTSYTPAPWDTCTGLRKNAEFSGPPTGARTGNTCSLSTKTPVCPTW